MALSGFLALYFCQVTWCSSLGKETQGHTLPNSSPCSLLLQGYRGTNSRHDEARWVVTARRGAAQRRPLVTVWATQSLTLGEQSLSGATETGPFTLENSLKYQRREAQACSCPERAVLQLPAALMMDEISSVPHLPNAIFLLR